jgi:arylsulfatase A-like enzyme
VPLFASEDFSGKSRRGLFGDVVEELDRAVGVVLDALRHEKLAANTLVIFTSDNGPWLTQGDQGGSAGLLRDGKGSTWEGGMREPAIAWRPGTVPAGAVSHELASTLDLLPTFAAQAGAELPKDRDLDGYDITPLLLEPAGVDAGVNRAGVGAGVNRRGHAARSPRQEMFYYRGFELMAARLGPWKAHFQTQIGYGQPQAEKHETPLLFHLDQDPGERFNVAEKHSEILVEIESLVARHRAGMKPAASQLEL